MTSATRGRPLLHLACLTLFYTPALATYFQKTCPHSPLPPSFLTYPHQPTSPAPVDDESPLNLLSRTPWTFPPYCVTPSSIGSTEKLCVYTASSYNRNTGISIIARPETAATLVDAVQNSTSAYAARRHIAGRSSHHQITANETLPYRVASIPGKGKGVIATRHIAQFDIIMTSFPAMVADNDLFPADEDEGPVEGPRLFKRALEQLTDQGRFLDLATSREGRLHAVEDVIRTNAFGIYSFDGRDAKGLYPEIARLNHGCDPNAYGQYTKGNLAMSAVATRDIEPGEEITISYIPLGMPTPYRHKALSNWDFTCTCNLCTSPPSALSASDERRNRLVELFYAMKQIDSSDPSTLEANYDTLVEYTREFVEIVQIEMLFPKVGEYYQEFMKMYYGFGDMQSAYRYAKTALRFAEMFADPEGGFCEGLRGDLGLLEGLAEQARLAEEEQEASEGGGRGSG